MISLISFLFTWLSESSRKETHLGGHGAFQGGERAAAQTAGGTRGYRRPPHTGAAALARARRAQAEADREGGECLHRLPTTHLVILSMMVEARHTEKTGHYA